MKLVQIAEVPTLLADRAWNALLEWHAWVDYAPAGQMDRTMFPTSAWWGLEWTRTNFLVPASRRTPPAVAEITDWVANQYDLRPNQINANKYLDGQGLIWHSDADPRGWLQKRTVSVSLGASRGLLIGDMPLEWTQLRTAMGVDPRDGAVPVKQRHVLPHGSVTVIDLAEHQRIVHAIEPGSGLRFSLNFREYNVGLA